MKLGILFAVFVSTYIAISHSNPNLRKGELIESIITKQTQGNYEEAINLFAAIGKLVMNQTVDLSDKEQKLYFDCYHYRRIQLRKDLVDTNKLLNRDSVEKKSLFYKLIDEINRDFVIGSALQSNQNSEGKVRYDLFWKKMRADKQYFEAWYTGGSISAYDLQLSYQNYESVLAELRTKLSDSDLMVLDACLGFSSAKLEYSKMESNSELTGPKPCDIALNGLTRGINASSEGNPDLVPLNQFFNNYCKPGTRDIIMDKYYISG